MRIFDRWRVVTVFYGSARGRVEGKEFYRWMSSLPHMTYRGALKEVKDKVWDDTLLNRADKYEHLIVRSTDTWK